jgi:putative hydrolase of the HAD superfamily
LPSPSIRAIVFDIGGVIVRVEAEPVLEALAASANKPLPVVRQAIQSDPKLPDFQEGRLTPWQWHQHLVQELGVEPDFGRFCEIWNSALDPVTLLDETLFAELRRRYTLVLLSNTDPLHVAHMEAGFSFLRHFPARVYSCAVGCRKPLAAIYRQAVARAEVAPELILYIDDVPEYVEAGRRAGMQAHRFSDPAGLLELFRAHGILK